MRFTDVEKHVESKEPPRLETKVQIRRQWNSWMIAECRLGDLSGIHWDNFSGGVNARSPRPFIHGYVSCDKIVGEIAHSCAHGEGPHRIKVCFVKKDNDSRVFAYLRDMAH